MDRADIISREITRHDRLVVILEDWAEWCARYTGRRESSGSVGLTSGYGASKSFDDMLDDINSGIARLVDATVDDLDAGQRAAINRRYGISAVFRFPRGNYADLLLSAHDELMVTLPKKGVVI